MTSHLTKAPPLVAAGDVGSPEFHKLDVQLDEEAPQQTRHAPHNAVDGQLPDVVPEPLAVQGQVVVIQPQVPPDAKPGIKDPAGVLVKLC